MPRAGPRKVHRYSLEFKLKTVKLSQLKGVEVQAVATPLRFIRSCCRGGGRRHATGCCAAVSRCRRR